MPHTRSRLRTVGIAGCTIVALAMLCAPALGLGTARAASARDSTLDQRLGAALAAGRIEDARSIAQRALSERERRERKPAARAAYADSLGLRFFMQGSPQALEAAEPFFLRALALREQAFGPGDLAVAGTASTLATLNDYMGRFERGLEFERRALAIRLAKLDSLSAPVAGSRRQIGLFLYYLGRYAEAETELAGALRAFAAARPPVAELLADALNNMGEVSRVQDRNDDAERYFTRGLTLADSALADDDAMRAVLVNNLAGLYKDLGRYADAEPLLERSLALRSGANADPAALSTAHLNLGEVYRLQGRLPEAEPHYAAALTLSHDAYGDDHPERILVLNQSAALYAALGQPARAETLYRETERITTRLLGPDHPVLANTLTDLGTLLAARGAYAAAESSLTRALTLRERALGAAHPEAAVTRVALAQCLAADPRAGDAAAAVPLARAIAVLDSSPAYPEARLDAWALRARITARAGQRSAAIADMRRALAAVDSLRAQRGGGDQTRAGFVAGHLDLYDTMIGWQLDAGDVAAAFETHERARARALLDQIAASGVDLRAGIPPAELAALDAAEAAARGRLAQAQRQLDALRARTDLTEAARFAQGARIEAARDSAAWELGRQREAMKDRSPLWRQVLSSDGRPAALADVQSELRAARRVLIEYHVGDRASWVFVIPPSNRDAAAYPLVADSAAALALGIEPGPVGADAIEQVMAGRPDARRLSARIGLADELSGRAAALTVETYAATDRPDRGELRLHALWRVLAPAPVWNAVRREARAVIAPDAALHLLPFDALVVSPRAPRRATRYWLDEGPATMYAASATSMRSLMRRPAASPPARGAPVALSVADPTFDRGASADSAHARSAWKPLPGTRDESQRVVRALAPEPVTVLAGLDATEPAVRAAIVGKRYVHIATHGFVTAARGDLLAGLVLTPPPAAAIGNADDGLLQLYEIYALPLTCELAVLSACETQRGPRVEGEGVFALSRGFLSAGARRVIASLWAVEDRATAELVASTFEGLAAGERRGDPADMERLLRDAKRRVRAQQPWSDPFYWAAFVLTGEP